MSTSVAKEDRRKRRGLVLRPNFPARGSHGVTLSSRRTSSVGGSPRRPSLSLGGGGSRVLDRRPAVRVFDEEGNDVTPVPLTHADAGAVQAKGSRFFLDEISGESVSEQTTTGSFTMPFFRSILGSSRISSQSTIESVNEEVEDTFPKQDVLPINLPGSILYTFYYYINSLQKGSVKEQVTDDMLSEVVDINITETDAISLLDIPSTSVSVDADDAQTIIEQNSAYAEVCKSRTASDKHEDRFMQTLSGAAKNKQVQTQSTLTLDAATTVTNWDMFDTLCGLEQAEPARSPEPERAEFPEAAMDTSRGAERSESGGSIASTGSSTSSVTEMEGVRNSANTEADVQLILQSDKLQQCLLVMERVILGNTLQPKLAAFRQLPVHEVKPETEDGTGSSPPALELLWTFQCELSKGRSVSSMAWNKKNPDLLAVGYGEVDSSNQRPGLVCCWSLKNSTWPGRAIHCESAVTSLDFSANNPGHLAVGMQDGSIAIYNVPSLNNMTYIISSHECPKKHLGPVWQLTWTQQELSSGEEKTEVLFSVAADGRMSKWFISSSGLDCIDLMKLKRFRNNKKAEGKLTEKSAESLLSAWTPGLCFDFHPIDSSAYLVGTGEGFIHRCSCSNNQQFLETYRKHFGAVNRVTWSPFNPSLFLSCSSDWTIQLWKQDHLSPILGFTSNQRAVCDIMWSPKRATMFGVVNKDQLEIWDLTSSVLDPVIVQPAFPGVKMSCLLFAKHTDCIFVGDSAGHVSVYQLKNMSLEEGSQAHVLESIIHSAVSK
ncbi:dynein axonemal intermediate chain 4 [Aulostomus maculatus]